MDTCKVEPLVASAFLQKTALNGDVVRSPRISSEKNNAASVATRKLPAREVASRFKSGVSSAPSSKPTVLKRCSSPTSGPMSPSPGVNQSKRATSVDRKRPVTSSQRSSTSSTPPYRPSTPSARPSTPSSPSSRSTTPIRDTVVESHNTLQHSVGRTPDGLWPSMRNLSSSFQLEPVTTAVSKKEKVVRDSSSQTANFPANGLADRKMSPLRGRNTPDQSENSKPLENSNSKIIDQHRWPSMLGGKSSGNALSRSVDLTDKMNGSVLSSRGVSPRRTTLDGPSRSLQQSLTKASRRLSHDGNGKVGQDMKSRGVSPLRTTNDGPSRSPQQSLTTVSRRLSLDGNAKFDQDTKSGVISAQPSERSLMTTRPSRTQSLGAEKDKNSAVATSSQMSERPLTGTRPSRMQTVSSSSLARSASPVLRFTRPSSPAPRLCRPSSPVPSINRSSSPSKAFPTSSSNRGMPSPSKTRPSTSVSPSANASNSLGAPSPILNYITDLQKGKKKANHLEDAHLLKLQYNVNLHWRFVNAQADETMMTQKISAENALQNTWNTISTLCNSVIVKRIDVQFLLQQMKLGIILNEQLEYLELWAALESEHCISLYEAIEALKASTLRLPVIDGARADIFDVKNAVSSAVDIMQAMGASICYLIAKVEGSKSLLSDLSIIAEKEKTMLDECRELLGSAALLQVQESSIITHLLQIQQDA